MEVVIVKLFALEIKPFMQTSVNQRPRPPTYNNWQRNMNLCTRKLIKWAIKLFVPIFGKIILASYVLEFQVQCNGVTCQGMRWPINCQLLKLSRLQTIFCSIQSYRNVSQYKDSIPMFVINDIIWVGPGVTYLLTSV